MVVGVQVGLTLLVVAVSIPVLRRLHDAVPSSIRAGVASGVGTLTWLTFVPFALVFGAVSERAGVDRAGWLLVAIAAVAALLVIVVLPRPRLRLGRPRPSFQLRHGRGSPCSRSIGSSPQTIRNGRATGPTLPPPGTPLASPALAPWNRRASHRCDAASPAGGDRPSRRRGATPIEVQRALDIGPEMSKPCSIGPAAWFGARLERYLEGSGSNDER